MSVLNKPVKPYTFTDGVGNLAYGSQVNADFDVLYNKVGDVIDVVNTTDYQTVVDTATLATDWASKTDGIVDATDYSAKAYAIGGTGVTDAAGSAKEWAIRTDDTVDGTDYSAKHYALSAKTAQGLAEDARDAAIAAASVVSDGDKGDITVSDSGATWTIDANVVAPSKMSRTGTAGQVLTSNGAGADPSYQTIPTASESSAGLIELATGAEALSGTDSTRAVTSAGLASASYFAQNGYMKLPGGLLLQWGRGSTTINGYATLRIYFPTSFSGDIACTLFEPVSFGGPNLQLAVPNVVADQLGSFIVTNNDAETTITQYRWFAIGW